MKPINLVSLVQLNKTGDLSNFKGFLELNSIEFGDREISGVELLIDILNKSTNFIPYNIYDGFYVGYKIPQIGKEFDLLRFGKNYCINIEIKSEIDINKIREQLVKNKYYLKFSCLKFFYISFAYDYASHNYVIYYLNRSNNLIVIRESRLISILLGQDINDALIIDNLFSPSNYLISPFNSTQRFLDREYFLTQHQDEEKKKIIGKVNNLNGKAGFVCLTGAAGTGKTLLLYDIAYTLMKSGKKVLVVHCGNLNDGHHLLNENGWKIIPIKNLLSNINGNDVFLIDEAQRIYVSQLNELIEKIRLTNNISCVFSLDPVQTLSEFEIKNDIIDKIKNIPNLLFVKLTERIRTNKEISDFIKAFFNNLRNDIKIHNSGNIELIYFIDISSAKNYINGLSDKWKVIQFTPSQRNKEFHQEYKLSSSTTSHSVIGQEFDNVVVVVDQYFAYNQDGELSYNNKIYYNATKMLFQNMTRVRRKIKIIFINNDKLFSRCLRIFKK